MALCYTVMLLCLLAYTLFFIYNLLVFVKVHVFVHVFILYIFILSYF